MAVNTKQKVDLVNVNDELKTKIEEKYANGWVIQVIVNLQPALNKLLIIYAQPEEI